MTGTPGPNGSAEPTPTVNNKFLEKLDAKRKQQQEQGLVPEQRGASTGQHGFDPALLDMFAADVPDIDLERDLGIAPQELALDDFIKRLTVVDAYNKWCGKTQITNMNQREIMVSCPNPQHADEKASCGLNLTKNLFNCLGCGFTGDTWDIAAVGLGYPWPGYKTDKTMFRNLRADIGRTFGIETVRSITGEEITYMPEHLNTAPLPQPPVIAPAQMSAQPLPTEHMATVSYTPEGSAYAEEQEEAGLEARRVHPSIDWRTIVPDGTFLKEFLHATTIDDCPEEFHFWSGLMALGFAVGRFRTLEDAPEVTPNLFVCLTGPTSTGKSKAKRHLTSLLLDHLPYKRDDQPPFGTRVLKGSQSGEVIIKAFTHPIIDSITQKEIGVWPAVRCMIDFEELSEIIGKSNRQGSTLKQTLMNLYDAPRILSSASLTHGDMQAELPFGSVMTSTQVKSIRDLVTRGDASSGFANRWVYAFGVAKPQFAVNRTQVDLTRSGGILRLINMNARAHETVMWNPDAEEIWADFFARTIVPFKKSNPDAEIAQRIDLLMKKLFLLFAINLRSLEVTVPMVEAALSLYPHLIESYQIIDEQISATQASDDTDLIIKHVQRLTYNFRGPTASELHKLLKRRISKISILRKMLEDMVMLGLLDEQKLPAGPRGGRPTSCFVVPAARSAMPQYPVAPQSYPLPPGALQSLQQAGMTQFPAFIPQPVPDYVAPIPQTTIPQGGGNGVY